MTSAVKPSAPLPWDRGNLEEWRAGHSEERKAADAKLLSNFFKLAAQVPQMKEALDWANDHGVEFIVDRTAKANGYYGSRTGIVGLSANVLKDPATAVGTVTHEIRHAWQDWYGMLSHPIERFADYFIRIVLIEADAEAFGARARRQYALRQKQSEYSHGIYKLIPGKKRIEKIEQQIEALQKNPDVLWEGFLGWFHRGRAAVYGDAAMKNLAKELGVPNIKRKDYNFEFKPFGGRELPERPAVDFTQEDQLRRLGKGFTGKNYFNGAARREDLRSIFRPDMAERFYNRKNLRPKLMNEIRKRVLRQKLEKAKALKSSAPA
jgi:hypothetical protein